MSSRCKISLEGEVIARWSIATNSPFIIFTRAFTHANASSSSNLTHTWNKKQSQSRHNLLINLSLSHLINSDNEATVPYSYHSLAPSHQNLTQLMVANYRWTWSASNFIFLAPLRSLQGVSVLTASPFAHYMPHLLTKYQSIALRNLWVKDQLKVPTR